MRLVSLISDRFLSVLTVVLSVISLNGEPAGDAEAKEQIPLTGMSDNFILARDEWLEDKEDATCKLVDLIDEGNAAAAALYLMAFRTDPSYGDSQCVRSNSVIHPKSQFWLEDIESTSPFLSAINVSTKDRTLSSRWPLEAGEYRISFDNLVRVNSQDDPRWELYLMASDHDIRYNAIARLTKLYYDGEVTVDKFLEYFDIACDGISKKSNNFFPLVGFCESRSSAEINEALKDFLLYDVEIEANAAQNTNEWLRRSLEATSYRKICAEICPRQYYSCIPELFTLSGAGIGFLARPSPINRLITQDDYWKSERLAGRIWRFLRGNYLHERENTGWTTSFNPRLTCFAGAMQDGQTRWDR